MTTTTSTALHPKYRVPICGHPVRGGGVCMLKPDHRGSHCWATYMCDGCGELRRGNPTLSDPESGLGFCFLCSGRTDDDERRRWRAGAEW